MTGTVTDCMTVTRNLCTHLLLLYTDCGLGYIAIVNGTSTIRGVLISLIMVTHNRYLFKMRKKLMISACHNIIVKGFATPEDPPD